MAALIAIPHLIQDDGRLLTEYAHVVKKADLNANPSLGAVLDQAFHFLALFLTALLVGSSYWASLRSASVGPFRRASVPGGSRRRSLLGDQTLRIASGETSEKEISG